MKVALIRNVQESRSLSMQLYADQLHDALDGSCDMVDVRLKTDYAYRISGFAGFRLQGYVGRFWSFPRQLRGLQTDIFHIVDHANAQWLRVIDPERTVVTCHDLMLLKLLTGEINWNGHRPLVASTTFHWSMRHLSQAKAILCVSENTKSDLIRLLDCSSDRLHVVHYGIYGGFHKIDDRNTLSESRKRFGLTWPVTILHVGSNIFYKNIEGIIEALALLPTWLHDVHFVKVGQNFTSKQWNLIRRLGLSSRVHFLGQLDIRDLVFLYNVVDILLFPSLYEGFGWPPLEGMACGTPVVCSDRGALKEVVEDAALIVDPGNPEAIAEGVERVLTDRGLREALIARGLGRAKFFSWEKTAERVLQVYHEIMGIPF